MRRHGKRRLGLRRTGRGTRLTSGVGSGCLTSVDRRVHAPLGTVANFSRLVTFTSSSRRHERCCRVVGAGGLLLVRLVGSVLSLSGVRTSTVEVDCRPISVGKLVSAVFTSVGLHVPRNIRLFLRGNDYAYYFKTSDVHLLRLVGGLTGGTVGGAGRKDVALKCAYLPSGYLRFCIGSAKANVTGSGLRDLFAHFIGIGSCIRNVNLKLTVYRKLIAGVNNSVRIRSRLKINSAFSFILPSRRKWDSTLFVVFLMCLIRYAILTCLFRPTIRTIRRSEKVFTSYPKLRLHRACIYFSVCFQRLLLKGSDHLLITGNVVSVSFNGRSNGLFPKMWFIFCRMSHVTSLVSWIL